MLSDLQNNHDNEEVFRLMKSITLCFKEENEIIRLNILHEMMLIKISIIHFKKPTTAKSSTFMD